MNNRLFTTFWHGGDLNPVSYTALKSFVDFGHRIQLFTYTNIGNVPPGVIVRDAREILDASEMDHYGNRLANFADVFRFAFLHREGGFWVDADVVCIRPDVPSSPVYLAYEDAKSTSVGAGALALPEGNPFARILANYSHDPGLVTPWEGRDSERRLMISKRFHSLRERRAHTGDYTFNGPMLLTNAAKHYNYIRYARPFTDLYTIGWSTWRYLFFKSDFHFDNMDYIAAWAIHCWGNMCFSQSSEILEKGTGQLSDMIRRNWKEAAP